MKRLGLFKAKLASGEITPERVRRSMAGWEGYAMMADTYRLRMEMRNSWSCFVG
jgi:hypothetical protein